MFRYALRRVLWSVPTLLATSLVLFFVTTLAPKPTLPDGASDAAVAAFVAGRRARFLDLPAFFNPHPVDVRARARVAMGNVSGEGPKSAAAARELVRLGGAALPYVLPRFDALDPDARRRVAVALAPLAERMGIGQGRDVAQPDAAVLLWTQFWDDRALDFTPASVEHAVARLVEHGSDLRERDLTAIDTFALRSIIRAMSPRADRTTLERLTRLAHHATGRGAVVESDDDDDAVRRSVADWHEWWFVYMTDFTAMDGADRVVAAVTDTRYGKWLRRIASGELGVSVVDGRPIAAKLREKAPVTFLLCALALLLGGLVAVPVGAVGAFFRGRKFDVVSSGVAFFLYATPTFAVAEALRRTLPDDAAITVRIALAVCALAVGSMATLARWQRVAMLDVLGRDFVRTAFAKGISQRRVLVLHALRNALLPVVTMTGMHLPALLGGAFIVEEVFEIPGIGRETLRAIAAHDSPWLMAVLLAAAVATTFGLVASDVAYAALDPRVRDVIGRRRGGLLP